MFSSKLDVHLGKKKSQCPVCDDNSIPKVESFYNPVAFPFHYNRTFHDANDPFSVENFYGSNFGNVV